MSTTFPSTRETRDAIMRALTAGPSAGDLRPLPPPDLTPYLSGPYANGCIGPRPDPATLVEQFVKGTTGWRTDVTRATEANWPQAVRAALDRRGCKRILIGTRTELQPALAPALEGLTVQQYDRQLQSWKHEMFGQIDAGITSSAAGIADTGSMLLWTGPGEPRTLSLIPPVHVLVLRVSRLYGSLAAALTALLGRTPKVDKMPTNLLLVSGPSKTADIQLILAYGAHGPKDLAVVLVDDVTGSNQEVPR